MRHDRVRIAALGHEAAAYTYILDSGSEHPDRLRPLVVVCPGGGYQMTADREAEPIAMQLNAMGMHVLLLRYSVAPARFPVALTQLAKCVALARDNAGDWRVDPAKVYVMGFSAGGHLAGSLGTLWNKGAIDIGREPADYRPDGMVLCYPVISSGECRHAGSFQNLCGEDEALRRAMSLETRVDAETPRCFLWHTQEDDGVPVENSLLMAGALRKHGVPFELHVYEKGRHGLSLNNAEIGDPAVPNVAGWIGLAGEWIRS